MLCNKCNKRFIPNNTQKQNFDKRCNSCRYKIWQKKLTKKYYLSYPWYRFLKYLRYRCNNKNSNCYNQYGGRGIRALITPEELKQIWFRDKGYLLKKPSVDRINSNGNYEYNNCRFIELIDNCKRNQRGVLC